MENDKDGNVVINDPNKGKVTKTKEELGAYLKSEYGWESGTMIARGNVTQGRELSLDEQKDVKGAGLFGKIWNGIKSAVRRITSPARRPSYSAPKKTYSSPAKTYNNQSSRSYNKASTNRSNPISKIASGIKKAVNAVKTAVQKHNVNQAVNNINSVNGAGTATASYGANGWQVNVGGKSYSAAEVGNPTNFANGFNTTAAVANPQSGIPGVTQSYDRNNHQWTVTMPEAAGGAKYTAEEIGDPEKFVSGYKDTSAVSGPVE